MDVREWQKRLEETFSVNGIVGGRLLDILNAEKVYGVHIAETYHGYSFLMNAFFEFYIETIQKAIERIQTKGWPQVLPDYSYTLLYYVLNFKGFRAADTLFMHGYPYDGYSLLRDLKDRSIFLGATIHKLTNFSLLSGVVEGEEVSSKTFGKFVARRRKEEKKIHDLMIGKRSGLPPEIVDELGQWEKMFHEEVHGSRFTLAEMAMALKNGKPPLSLKPSPNENGMAMYMNRASEIGWLLTRTLPFLQLEVNNFGEKWKSKYKILDESFEVMIQGLEKIGKKIATCFIYFVKNKFIFPEDLHYSE